MITTTVIMTQFHDGCIRAIIYQVGDNPYPFEGGMVETRTVKDFNHKDFGRAMDTVCKEYDFPKEKVHII